MFVREIMKLFFLLLSFMPLALFANCAEVNLQTQQNSPLNEIPVYNQDGLGSCYAYAASQLIDYARFKIAKRTTGGTNPIWLALLYAESEGNKSLETGGPAEAIDIAKSKGVCKERVVAAALAKYKNNNKITDAELANFIETLNEVWSVKNKETIQDIYKNAQNSCRAKGRVDGSLLPEVIEIFKRDDGKIDKVIPRILMDELLKSCSGGNLYNLEIGEVKESCGHCTDSEIQNKISSILKDKSPVAISYCSAVLKDKNYRGIDDSRNDNLRINYRSYRIIDEEDRPKKNGQVVKGCGKHASLIVGSRSVGGKCQYLLRNSWGSTSYKDHPSCLCETSKGKYEECKHGDGKPNKVGCWIDSDALTPNIYRLTHIEDK